MENSLGSNTSPPSLLPSSTVMADAFPAARAAEAALVTKAAPTASLRDARTESLGAAEEGEGILAATPAGLDAALRPANDGMEKAAEVTAVIFGEWNGNVFFSA